MTARFDEGLQPERTELAWRRTALSIAIGAAVAMRLLPVAWGSAWWSLIGVGGLLFAGALWAFTRRRSERTRAALLTHGDRVAMPGAIPLAALALFVGLVGLSATLFALSLNFV